MDLLTIGAFARASRLSPKALRLYDSLGLLTPAHVDEASGYRFYRPDQLERARLVAWLRRLGMPLARIGIVCDLARDAPDQAAEQIAAYERAPQKYHHTVSRAWTELVAHHVAEDPGCADFERFADRNSALLDKRLLSRHYRSSTLAAEPARHGWVEPDLLPFPWSGGNSTAG